MASTYTTRIRLEKQGDGENPNSWGAILNQNVIDLVDDAIAAYTTIVVSSADVTLTTADGTSDQARSAFLELSGTVSSSLNVLVPEQSKGFIVNDKTTRQNSATITVKTASGSGTAITSGEIRQLVCDKVSVFTLTESTGVALLSASNTFTDTNTFASAVGFATSVSATEIFASAAAFNSITASVGSMGKATFTKQVAGTPVTLTDAASIALNLTTGTNFIVSLGGNRTLENPSNAAVGQTGQIYVIQDSTGSRTLAFGDAYNFENSQTPVMSTSANSVDLLVYNVRGVSAIDTVFVSSFG
tara:strand:+ start:78 stop:980 length:903 start_codon:yes stop_codon:yes gene_type:complete